mgnify:CR=1 FL=1
MATRGRRLSLAGALLALVAACAPAAGAQVPAARVEALDRQGATEIVVRREPGLTAAERAAVRADADVEFVRHSRIEDTELVRAEPGALAEAVAELNRDPDVVFAEPVTVQSAQAADPYFGFLWGLENTGQKMLVPGTTSWAGQGYPDADMDVPQAWTNATGLGVTVAIVDSGALLTHPDLVAQLTGNPGERGEGRETNGIDDDGNGYVDDWQGWDFVTNYPQLNVTEGDGTPGPDNVPQDDHGHGTHVAGTVAAQADNNEGIAGVAPGARILPLRALGATGQGTSLAVAEAFDYAGKLGVPIVNASLGGVGLDQAQLAAIQAHPNTLYVIAAGNANVNVDNTPYGPCALPAANILCVGASDEYDRRASFSNFGATHVDVFAPGTAILSTSNTGGYEYKQGTSMAAPNAAGVAALVLSARPVLGALELKSAIMGSVDPKPDLAGKAVTGGRVNADRAVSGTLGGAPVSVSAPVITGVLRQGATLSASTGFWDPAGATYEYRWQRSTDDGATWATIPGATDSTYVPGISDIGARLRVTVVATNAFGVATATSPEAGPVGSGAPAYTQRPAIAGTPRRGQTLSVSSNWNPLGTTYTYQWERSADGVDWEPIGADANTFTLTTGERLMQVRVTVTAKNPYGQTTVTTDPVGPVEFDPPFNHALPTISGQSMQRTSTLSATPGTWGGANNATTYQWQREDGADWVAIPGATGLTYQLTKDDEGRHVRVLVTATNPDGNATAASLPSPAPAAPFPPANTTAPVVSGIAQRGRQLTATRGTWTGPDNFYTFQWQREFGEGWVAIEGAIGASYTLTAQDVDATVRVLVTAANPDGTIVEASEPTAPVMPAGPLNQTPPVVSGSAQRGGSLNGVNGTWSGSGNLYAYQWQSSLDGMTWDDIAGATTTAYAPRVADVGRFLRLLVIASNADGTLSTPSAPTARVSAAPPVNSVAPSIVGTVQRGQSLSAQRGTWSGNGNVYGYQWQRDGVDIPEATGAAYTLTVADVGTRVRVVVTATNADATVSVASAATVPVPSSPPVNTAPPTVNGLAERGRTLTGTAGSWGGIANSVKYQWQSSQDGTTWTAIAGATSANRLLGASEVGRFVRLLVTVSNAEAIETMASAPTARVAASPPLNSVRPVISGTAQRGQTLIGTLGTWSGQDNVYDYRWQRSADDGATWTDIAGATRPTYDLAVGDVGKRVRLLVTATNPDGTLAASSTPTAVVPGSPPVNTAPPTITGTARRGVVLQGTSGGWDGVGNVWAYQWQRSTDGGASWQDIVGATKTTYTLAAADVGAIVRLRVTASNAEDSATETSLPTGVVTGDGPVNTVAPVLAGTARRGSTLGAVAGTWSGVGNVYALQWQRSADGAAWTDIEGAKATQYTLTAADVGQLVRVRVTATNPDGTGVRESAPSATVEAAPPVNVGLPTVTGAAKRATTLTATQGAWTGPGNAYAYQWQRDAGEGWVDITGALALSYKLTVDDVGARVRLRVTATNPDGTATAASLPSVTVQAGPPGAVHPGPEISGTARRSERLSSRLGEWIGIDNAYAYQWQRRPAGETEFADIPGATHTTYVLVSPDVGAEVRLKVTATNADGTAVAYSDATAAVQAAPPVNLAAPTVSGPPRLYGVLTARRGEWTPEADYEYQWQRDGDDIVNANGSTYVLTPDDVGAQVRVKITAVNVDGRTMAVSAPTARVAAPPVNLVAPAAPEGTPRQGSTLTAVRGTWDAADAMFAYEWVRCAPTDAAIVARCDKVGAGTTYILSQADIGLKIGVRVRAITTGGETVAESALTPAIAMQALSNTTRPGISGHAYVGETLVGDGGRWTFPNTSDAYDWRRCDADGQSHCTSVGDGTPRYRVKADDEGHTIVLVITAGYAGQTATAESRPVAVQPRPVPGSATPPVVTGISRRGELLSATAGTWSNAPARFSFQWVRCAGTDCQPIAGAMLDSYRVTKADQGFGLAVLVTATNQWGTGTARSDVTAPAQAGPPVNVQAPVIQGAAQQGVTLSMTGYTWDATADTAYGFSWERCDGNGCTAIPGATGDRYTLVAADVGFTIVAVSTASNVDGAVAARSAATDVVGIAGPRWKTLPLLSSSSGRVGDVLRITPGTWSGPELSDRTVQLMRCTDVCVPRGAADVDEYTIVDGDIGAILRVRETASNAGGSVVLWSARYVGPVVGVQGASAVLSTKEAPLRNARGRTLAYAKLRAGARAAAAKGPKVALRRPAKLKGKLVAWACPAAVAAGATPPKCSKRVKLGRRATITLPAGTSGKVRVVVIRR